MAWGLDRDKALRAITIDAAEILGVADRVGSLEVGQGRQPRRSGTAIRWSSARRCRACSSPAATSARTASTPSSTSAISNRPAAARRSRRTLMPRRACLAHRSSVAGAPCRRPRRAQTSSIVAIQGARIVPVQGRADRRRHDRLARRADRRRRRRRRRAAGRARSSPARASRSIRASSTWAARPGIEHAGRAPRREPADDRGRRAGEGRLSAARPAARRRLRQPERAALARAAAAGITSILATPAGDAFRGQSALINTALPPDEPQIGAVADERKGALVVRTPVALHVTLLGAARRRQRVSQLADGRHRLRAPGVSRRAALPGGAALRRQHRRARRRGGWRRGRATSRRSRRCSRRLPAGMPVAFRGESAREILRALDMAKAFKLETDRHRRARSGSGRARSQGRRRPRHR